MPVVGAIIPSEFARENPQYTNGARRFYWMEGTRKKKTRRKQVHSSDGRTYHFSKEEKNEVCYYRCKTRGPCTGTLIIDPRENGKVVDNVIHVHTCEPSQEVICRGKKVQRNYLEDSGHFTSTSMSHPVSPSSIQKLLPSPIFNSESSSVPQHTLLLNSQPSFPEVTGASSTEDDLSMQQGSGPLLGLQSFLPGTTDALSTEVCLSMQQGSDPPMDYQPLPQLHPDDQPFLSTGEAETDTRIQSSAAITEDARPLNIVKLEQRDLPGTVVIHCELDRGHPSSNVNWCKDSTVIDFRTDARITIVKNKDYEQLHIRDFQQCDVGVYELCNDVGCAVGSIAVPCNGPKFIINPHDFNAPPGFPAEFSGKAIGHGIVRYQWKHNGEDITDGRVTGSNGPDLKIHATGVEDEGKYELVASNEHGEVYSTPASLKLIRKEELFMAIPQSDGPTLSFLNSAVSRNGQNLGQFDQNFDFAAESLTTSCTYNVVPTEATDPGDSSDLVSGHLDVKTVSTTDLKSSIEATDPGDSSDLVIGHLHVKTLSTTDLKRSTEATDRGDTSQLITELMQEACQSSDEEIISQANKNRLDSQNEEDDSYSSSLVSETVSGGPGLSMVVSGKFMFARTFI